MFQVTALDLDAEVEKVMKGEKNKQGERESTSRRIFSTGRPF